MKKEALDYEKRPLDPNKWSLVALIMPDENDPKAAHTSNLGLVSDLSGNPPLTVMMDVFRSDRLGIKMSPQAVVVTYEEAVLMLTDPCAAS